MSLLVFIFFLLHKMHQYFTVFTIVIIIVILLTTNLTTAIILIPLILALHFLGNEMPNPKYYKSFDKSSDDSSVESSDAMEVIFAKSIDNEPYPGSIDLDEYDSYKSMGHSDRKINDEKRNDEKRLSKVAAPYPGAYDDEANNAEIDGDERINYQNLSRNDETRVIAGTIKRKNNLSPYIAEELAAEEESRWWGRHEI